MKKNFLPILATLLTAASASAQLTLDRCLELAEANYPLIAKYALVENSQSISLNEINKTWLPRVSLSAQGTIQNEVPGFPSALRNAVAAMGQDIRGLANEQYKMTLDVNQTIWDGGVSVAKRNAENARTGEATAALGVQFYAVRERVESLFFGILLIDGQIAQTQATIALLEANLARLQTMVREGTAMQSDADMVEARILSMQRDLLQAQAAECGYREALALFIGENIDGQTLVRPELTLPASDESQRPELTLFDAKDGVSAANRRAINVSLMPHISFFAQAYYGYPGYNYFENMMNRKLSFNALAGLKITWNIDAFYTRNDSRRRLDLADRETDADREVFIFNSSVQARTQRAAIRGLQEAMANDARIVSLLGNVRRAAESQLANGIIDATDLLTKITDENQAQITLRYHEIELLQQISKLKYLLNQ